MYNVYLVDPLVCIGRQSLYFAIYHQLKGYFDQIVRRLQPPDTAQVLWTPAEPQPRNHELLVYFTPTEFSVVARFSGKAFDPLAHSHWGYTGMKTQNGRVTEAASEVYAKMLDADILAKLAFHECMHNKLGLGSELHNRNGLAAAVVDANSRLTPENIADMARALHNPVPQWRGGTQIMVGKRLQRDAGDPLWYL